MRYEDMLRGVLGRVPGCPEGEAVNAMRNACMEFCAESSILTVGATVTVDPLSEQTAVPTDTQVIDIIEARIDGKPVLVTWLNDPRVDELRDGERAVIFANPNLFTLMPAPAAAVTVELLIVAAPGPDSIEVADTLWLRYSEALEHGCLARLMEQPKKPWSDAATAVWHRGKFDDEMRKAEVTAARNRQTSARVLRTATNNIGGRWHRDSYRSWR